MSNDSDFSQKASELITFFDDQGCLGISEFIKWLESEQGKKLRKAGTSVFGIRHKFTPEMTTDEKMMIYATYSNPIYLGSLSGEKRPIDTLEDLKDAIAKASIQGRQEFDHFCLELLEAVTDRKDPEIGMAFSLIFDP